VIEIAIADQQTELELDQELLRKAIRMVIEDAGIARAEISLAVVDDQTIARLNEEYLDHQGPTDVLSFLLEREGDMLEGEVIVGAQTARRQASRFDWPAENELLLYVIHGTLHLVGYDDATADQRAAMQEKERACLLRCGLDGHYNESDKAQGDETS
jgi:probable rRNA maturation factor